jgi:hypothetical protein
MGASKYGDDNYLAGMSWRRVKRAAITHLDKFWSRTADMDEESGLPHLAHSVWNLMTLLTYWLHDLGTDDRPTLPGGLFNVHNMRWVDGKLAEDSPQFERQPRGADEPFWVRWPSKHRPV